MSRDKPRQHKNLILLTGPQGSGNHLWSKIFALHPEVDGWKDLIYKYWIPSDKEPFAECWVNPTKAYDLLTHNNVVMNVSVPFVYNGVKQFPQIQAVVDIAKGKGYNVTVCIVCRDENINREQQKRVRHEETLDYAMKYFEHLKADFAYLSTETLYLHRNNYLKWLSRVLNFPIAYDHSTIKDILKDNQNKKYVKYVDQHWNDYNVWMGIKPWSEQDG